MPQTDRIDAKSRTYDAVATDDVEANAKAEGKDRRPSWKEMLHATPFRMNDREEDHHHVGEGGEVEFKYLGGSHAETAEKLRSHNTLAKHAIDAPGGWKHSVMLFIIFMLTLLASALVPISVTSAKQGHKQFPFMLSTFMMGFKGLVLVASFILMKAGGVATSSKKKKAEDTAPLPFKDQLTLGLFLLPPAVLYTLGDLLAFPILQRVNPATYATLNQMKIVVVAFMFRFLLKRNVSMLQWVAIIQLIMGALLFKSDILMTLIGDSEDGKPVPAKSSASSQMVGIGFLFIKILAASVASVWLDWSFKRHVKDKKRELTFTQQQLFFAIWTVLFSVIYFLATDLTAVIAGRPFFDGWSIEVVGAMSLFAFYGILVSLFIKTIDALSKLVMNLLGVILTTIFAYVLFGSKISLIQIFALVFILLSAFVFKIGKVTKKMAKKKKKEEGKK